MSLVAVYEYQKDEVIIDDSLSHTDEGDEPPAKITHDEYAIMKQKYDEFLIDYNKLVESQRNVIPYPINYSYVTGEGWVDTDQGIEWCSNLSEHTDLVQLLFTELSESLDQFNTIENKTPQMIELIDTKYNVLSNTISEEIKSLEYKYFQVHCESLFEVIP